MDKLFQNIFTWNDDNGSDSSSSFNQDYVFPGGSIPPKGNSPEDNLRDSMLKSDDSKCDKSDSLINPPVNDVHPHDEELRNHPFFGNGFFNHGRGNDSFPNSFPGCEDSDENSPFSFSFRMVDPFGLMNEMMRSFEDFGRFDDESFTGTDPSIGFEDTERKDKDLDSGDDYSRLMLKEEPGYIGASSSPVAPEKSHPFSHSFKSTSIVRIRKPDGTIEETKKYTDSTGVEKITVTTSEPNQGNDQIVLKDGSPEFGGLSRNPFSWFSFFR